jgi:release factor glutamine methyltransferase
VTVLEVLQSTATYFAKKKVESPRLNIEHLLADVLGKKRIDLYLEFDRVLTEKELDLLREKVRRRAEGEPLQHILGHWDFFGRTFKTDSRALVPRPETELLVESVLAEMGSTQEGRLIDVGTGTGILAITFALEKPGLTIYATDISESALALARENAERLGVLNRIQFIQSELVDAVEGPIDLVVANLPYIPTGQLPDLPSEVRFDPVLALDGGPDGLTPIRKLIESTRGKLSSNSLIALEVGWGQAGAVRDILAHSNYRDISLKKDYLGIERILIARYG